MLGTYLHIAAIVALEISVFALAVFAFDRFAPKRWVSERHNLALAGFLVLPLLLAFASQPRSAATTEAIQPVESAQITPIEAASFGEVPLQPVVAARSLPIAETAESGIAVSFTEMLLAVWVAGTALMLVRLVQDMVLLGALRGRSQNLSLPSGIQLSRRIHLRRSSEIDAPMVAGLLEPVVLVPDNFEFDSRAGCVLEHEIAHIVRGDAWTELFIRLATSLFWWVVPLHLMHGIVRRTRESLCDARSANVTGAPIELAHALLDAATRMSRVPPLALSAKPTRSTLSVRIDHLTSDTDTPRRPLVMRMPIVLPAFALLAYAATPQLGEARESQEREQVIFVHEGGDDELKGGRSRVYINPDDLDLEEIEIELERVGREIEARMEEINFDELETRLDQMSAEIDARMAAIDFSEFEADMEALGAELEARLSEIDFSEYEHLEFDGDTEGLNQRERARLEGKLRELDTSRIEERIRNLELTKLAELEQLERVIEAEVGAKLAELDSLAELSQLSSLAALAALKNMPHPPHAPEAPHAPHHPERPKSPHAPHD